MASGKRHSYTIGYKLQVVAYAKEHGNRAAERHFGPPPTEKMIRYWRKQEDKLKPASKVKRNLHGCAAKWPELEQELKNWIVEERSAGRTVSTKTIINEAKLRAAAQGMEAFLGTSSWCYRFMKRHGLSLRTKTRIAQKMPADYENKIIAFHKYVINARKETDYELGQIGNMDEVPLTFDVVSNRTVDVKGSKTITIKTSGHEKTHYTAVLSCCADGTKLPPLLIFKRKTLPKDKIPRGIFIHVHPKGWMDEEGLKIWLDKVWSRRPGGLLKKPSLLVWDQFRAHLTTATKERVQKLKSKLAVIPGGLTSQLQPLDVSINKPFKSFMKEEWNQWMKDTDHALTPSGRLKRPSITQVCEWVLKSWNSVKTEIVVKSFKKCGISNAMDGTEDDILFEESVDSDSIDDPDAASQSDGDYNSDFSGFEDMDTSRSSEFSGFED